MPERLPTVLPRRHLLLLAGLAAVGLLTLSFGRMLIARYELGERTEAARREIAALQAENASLRQELAYWQSDEGVERLAREELGWARPGETGVVVVGADSPKAWAPAPRPPREAAPNWQRWWQLFFGG